ncbi:MAG: uroporphyrinogen decarboxylase family protein [Bacteroidota bacterium]
MTSKEWNNLLEILDGKQFNPLPVGFIIDSPWLPGWDGISAMDYYSSDDKWLKANFNAIDTFPEIMFLPGFWSEYGMCTEPSAFGSKMVWDETELPHADKVIHSTEMIDQIIKPNVEKDGLLPFTIKRLQHHQSLINERGHSIKFAVSRGPLNIASFLMGATDFMIALMMEPDKIHKLLTTISNFVSDWLKYQIKLFPTIEGIFMLDDIVGFLGDDDMQKFVVPYLKNIYDQFDVPVKFFHNDAEGKICAPYLEEIGINLFNYSFTHSINEMRELCGEKVTLLGNIPPRDVLANGTAEDVANAVVSSLNGVIDRKRIIMSCGGGMPPNVSTENINAFVTAVKSCK